MFAFSAIGMFLWLEVLADVSSQSNAAPSDAKPSSASFTLRTKNGAANVLINPSKEGNKFYFYGNHQTLYFNSSNPLPISSLIAIKPGINGNVSTDPLGTYMVVPAGRKWNGARKNCARHGGELVIIRSDAEHKHVEKLMRENIIAHAWVGFHDQFEEGEWVSLWGEDIEDVGWGKWSSMFKPNPDNWNYEQHCARLMRDGDGMDDLACKDALPFVCKLL